MFAPSAALPAPADPAGEKRAHARLDRARALLGTGRLADTIRAAAGLVDVPVGEVQTRPAAVPGDLTEPLRGSVAWLLGAVQEAGAGARAALRATPAELGRVAERALALFTRAKVERGRDLANGHGPALGRLIELDAWSRRMVDRDTLFTAGLMLARAIDRELPVLRSAVRALRLPSSPSDGCDVLEHADLLCIGGLGPNTYTEDFALQIDLGGDDTYRNSAGGADPEGNGLNISVTVDLDGDDRYEAALPVASGARVAQGAAYEGGIGMLVDAAGDDSYLVTGGPGAAGVLPLGVPNVGALGQGYATAGVGLLADLGGSDRYRLEDWRAGGTWVRGQGVSAVGGASALLDLGLGDDTYEAEAGGPVLERDDGSLDPGYHYAIAFGLAALGAAAIFADDGGSDAMTARATAPTIPPEETRRTYDGLAVVDAFGAGGVGGATVSITGPGPTVRVAEATAEGPTLAGAVVDGFGIGFGPAFGALVDAGGDDLYLTRVQTRAVRHATIDDGCECDTVAARARNFLAEATGLGFGYAGGTGLALDEGGNDRYEWEATMLTEAVARDEREEPGPPPPQGSTAAATAEGGTAVSVVLGASVIGNGFFEDVGGDDVYLASLRNTTRAEATSLDPLAEREARASDYQSSLVAQGAAYLGYGELRDLGGTDRYTTTAVQSVTADPPTEVDPAVLLVAVQAGVVNGSAMLLDLDGGAVDTFAQTPPAPACLGTRGQGAWVDCGTAIGFGFNA